MKVAAFPNGAQGLAHAHSSKVLTTTWAIARRTSLHWKPNFHSKPAGMAHFHWPTCVSGMGTQRAEPSRAGGAGGCINPIPVPQFPTRSQQSPRLLSTGRALKMEYELWKHHLPCARNASPGAQCPQLLPWHTHQLFGFMSKVNPAHKVSSRQRSNTINAMKTHSEKDKCALHRQSEKVTRMFVARIQVFLTLNNETKK